LKYTYAQLTAQITELQRRANEALRREVAADIRKVGALIASYGPNSADVFRTGVASTVQAQARPVRQFADGNGNAWIGRGPRPHWLRDALSRGRSLNEFRTQ